VVKAAGYGANFLLNVGPMPNGKIQPEHIASLKGVGEWLNKNGETIYGTRGGSAYSERLGCYDAEGQQSVCSHS
jgi:alpha-L-fucosidase